MSNKKKIMVIDDDERLLETTRFILEKEGYEVLIYNRAIGSISNIRNFRPDLVLLDINMPALSGESLAGVINSTKSLEGAKIVFYSSNDEDSLREAVLKNGIRGYICKGDLIGLRRKVASFIAEDEAPVSLG